MARSWMADPLLRHVEARRRLTEWRLRRIRRSGRRVVPWAAVVWLLVNVPAVVLLAAVAVKRVASAGELVRYTMAVGMWAVISGIGVAVAFLGGIIAVEAVGRYQAMRRKHRFHGE